MKRKLLLNAVLAVAAALSITSSTQAASINWTDWTSSCPEIQTAAGTMTFGSEVVNVSLSGNFKNIDNSAQYYKDHDVYYYEYEEYKPTDLVEVDKAGNFLLTFSKAVKDPFLALVSVGRPDLQVDYAFENPFTVLSSGPNQWTPEYGYAVSGNTLEGNEYNGVLRFFGTYTSLEFNVSHDESSNGFNIGSKGFDPCPVPEPSSIALGLMSLGGMLGFRRKNKV